MCLCSADNQNLPWTCSSGLSLVGLLCRITSTASRIKHVLQRPDKILLHYTQDRHGTRVIKVSVMWNNAALFWSAVIDYIHSNLLLGSLCFSPHVITPPTPNKGLVKYHQPLCFLILVFTASKITRYDSNKNQGQEWVSSQQINVSLWSIKINL